MQKICWADIDWVLLDMDGTLLDLHFDSYFWQEHVPAALAKRHYSHLNPTQAISSAKSFMAERYSRVAGTLDWYSVTYWSQTLDLPIMKMKEDLVHLIRFRSDSVAFLKWLKAENKTRVLLTNAHRENLTLKHRVTGILDHIDQVIVSHELNYAKETPLFWQLASQHIGFDINRSMFIDDNHHILSVAQKFGIKLVLGIEQPDSKAKAITKSEFPCIKQFSYLIDQ